MAENMHALLLEYLLDLRMRQWKKVLEAIFGLNINEKYEFGVVGSFGEGYYILYITLALYQLGINFCYIVYLRSLNNNFFLCIQNESFKHGSLLFRYKPLSKQFKWYYLIFRIILKLTTVIHILQMKWDLENFSSQITHIKSWNDRTGTLL